MTTPYEALTQAFVECPSTDFDLWPPEDIATAAIEALREGAIERANAATLSGDGFPMVNEHRDAIIEAILGPPLTTDTTGTDD